MKYLLNIYIVLVPHKDGNIYFTTVSNSGMEARKVASEVMLCPLRITSIHSVKYI